MMYEGVCFGPSLQITKQVRRVLKVRCCYAKENV